MNPCVKLQVTIFILIGIIIIIYICIISFMKCGMQTIWFAKLHSCNVILTYFVLFHLWNVVHRPHGLWHCILKMQHKNIWGICVTQWTYSYLVHWFTFDFICLIHVCKCFKPLVIVVQMHQCLSAYLLQEILGVLNENSPCFKAVLHLRVVSCITFGFLFFLIWALKTCVNSSLVAIGMVKHHTGVIQMGDLPGWFAI